MSPEKSDLSGPPGKRFSDLQALRHLVTPISQESLDKNIGSSHWIPKLGQGGRKTCERASMFCSLLWPEEVGWVGRGMRCRFLIPLVGVSNRKSILLRKRNEEKTHTCLAWIFMLTKYLWVCVLFIVLYPVNLTCSSLTPLIFDPNLPPWNFTLREDHCSGGRHESSLSVLQ